MGRETKILLALLATLAGVFVGVLSMKLLVPRPPAGAGPDVHVDIAAAEPHELVSPPTLSHQPADAGPGDRYRSGASGFAANDGDRVAADTIGTTSDGSASRRDPFVAAASLEQPIPTADRTRGSHTDESRVPADSSFSPAITPPAAMPPPADQAAIEPQGISPDPTSPGVRPAAASTPSLSYVATAGDSWWDLAERAYGDGRLYRALFAWNRVVDPRVSLAPGTRLEIPPRERLEAAWPKLMPPREAHGRRFAVTNIERADGEAVHAWSPGHPLAHARRRRHRVMRALVSGHAARRPPAVRSPLRRAGTTTIPADGRSRPREAAARCGPRGFPPTALLALRPSWHAANGNGPAVTSRRTCRPCSADRSRRR